MGRLCPCDVLSTAGFLLGYGFLFLLHMAGAKSVLMAGDVDRQGLPFLLVFGFSMPLLGLIVAQPLMTRCRNRSYGSAIALAVVAEGSVLLGLHSLYRGAGGFGIALVPLQMIVAAFTALVVNFVLRVEPREWRRG